MRTSNICQSIECPYYKSSGSSGCTFYTFADQCHLLPDSTLLANKYFIYAPEMDTSELRAKNDAYFASNDRYQRQVYVQQNVEGMKDAMEFPNGIIPPNTPYLPT